MSHLPYYGQDELEKPQPDTGIVQLLAEQVIATSDYISTMQQLSAKQLSEYSKAWLYQMPGSVD
jgi:hypothetical protein